MILLGWYLGVALKAGVTLKVLLRLWALRLPCFTILMAAILVNDGLALTSYGTPRSLVFYRAMAPILAAAQILSTVEAFWALALCLPRFKRPGLILMAFCAAFGLAIERWTRPESLLDSVMRGSAVIERGLGFGLFFFSAAALFAYSLTAIPAKFVWRHAVILSSVSLINGVAWQMMERKLAYVLWVSVMTWGTAIAFAAWIAMVHGAPSWSVTKGRGDYDREDQENRWQQMGKAAGL